MPTPQRAAEIRVRDGGRLVSERWLAGPPCRLIAVLCHERPSAADTDSPSVIGAAWIDDAGESFWGWPSDDGTMALRTAPGGDWRACLLPPAMSLALSMRRRGTDFGLRAVVLGAGFAAEIAMTAAEALGCRVTHHDAGVDANRRPDWSAPIIIEASGTRTNLEIALARCEDWGVVYSMAGGQSASSIDYYTEVHRRALSLFRVPDVPVPGPGEDELIDGGAAVLIPALSRRVSSEPGSRETAAVRLGDRRARLVRDASGLCVVTVEGP
jgi:hypothetical protein